MGNRRVLIVGSAEQSAGGVATVIRQMKQMPVWQKYHCRWLGTQIQRSYAVKLWYAIKAHVIALFVIWRYDIVHFHTVPDRIGLVIQMPVLLMAMAGRKKVIVHLHTGNQLSRNTDNQLFRWWLQRADLIILLADRWQKLFKELYADINTPTAVLYNPCEEVPETPQEEKEKLIIMAALFNDNKAPDLLLHAWQKIKDRHPGWRIAMLGNGEVERYRRMAADMGLQDSVTFTGYVTGTVKASYFRRASILCVCSYEEGFPMVVLEAWMHGICVVTTPVGGLPDVLEDGKNALVFDFGHWEQLANHLERLIDDEALRRTMGAQGRHFISAHFSIQQINDQLAEIYQDVILDKSFGDFA